MNDTSVATASEVTIRKASTGEVVGTIPAYGPKEFQAVLGAGFRRAKRLGLREENGGDDE